MKITVNYGTDVVCVPASVIAKTDKATKRDLRILFALLASKNARKDFEGNCERLASEIGCTVSDVSASLSFWRGTGIIEVDEESRSSQEEKAESKILKPQKNENKLKQVAELAEDLPKYTTAELNAILEKHKESAMLLDECQNILGKIFNPQEITTMVALKDYLDLEDEFLLLLVDHCSKRGKKTVHYIKKCAFTFYNEGITSAHVLREHLNKLDAMCSVEGKIRSMFGMLGRELTTKEKKLITSWVCDLGYGVDVIKKAYEMTVDATQNPSPSYANAILERWHSEGLNDLEAIEKAEAQKAPSNGSFDTDDFFEAALKRSFNN